MTKWQPTCELRFVERDGEQVLQQKWERFLSEWYENKPEIKWRDVPVEVEQ